MVSELYAVNGTIISAEERDELVFSLDPSQANFSTIQSQFRIVGNQLEVNKPNGYTLVDNQQYDVSVRVTDVNGNGLFSNCTFSFLVGAAAVPEAIANGWQNSSNIYAYCGDNLEVQFLNSSTIEFRSSLSVDGITYPSPQTGQVYNVLAEASSGSTGALSQGAMTITGTLTSTISDAIVDVTIQKRSGLVWVQAVDSNGVTINNISLVSNSVDSFSKTFDSPGEYRLISNIIGDNAGGHFAHLGGALFGFLYVNKVSNKDLNLFDQLSSLFKSKKSPLKTVHKSKKKQASSVKKTDITQQQVDTILDKISKSGYDTLTKSEKEFLFKQGKK